MLPMFQSAMQHLSTITVQHFTYKIVMGVALDTVLFKESKASFGCLIIYTPSSLDFLYIHLYKVIFNINTYYGESENTGILTTETGAVIDQEAYKINLTHCGFYNNTSINGPVFHLAARSNSNIPIWLANCNFRSNTGIIYFETGRISLVSSNIHRK